MRLQITTGILAALALSAPAVAQTVTTTTIVREEAVPPAIVEIPPQVRTYVVEQARPSVTLEGRLVRGEVIPEDIEYYSIPDNDDYGYAIVNDRRVIIQPDTREIIEVYD